MCYLGMAKWILVKGQFWVEGYFYVLFFLYIKSSSVFLFAVFLMKKGNKKLLKKKKSFG